MRYELEDFGVSIDVKEWAHKYFKEHRRHVFRKDPEEPFPNLQVRVDDVAESNLHESTDVLVETIKKQFPDEVRIEDVQKSRIKDFPAISMRVNGIEENGLELMMLNYIISTGEKLIMLRFILKTEQFETHVDEIQEIAQSIEII
ncbi:MAG: hypothetical protein ACTSRW_04935 [Candidatus Helarchaeota archaeon]